MSLLHSENQNCESAAPKKKRWKIKCTLVQALRLCTGRTVHSGNRGISLIFLDHGTRRGWWVSVTSRPPFTSGKYPVPFVQEAGWAPEPVWTDLENLARHGTRSPDRPARSQSLYRLRYPAYNQPRLGTWNSPPILLLASKSIKLTVVLLRDVELGLRFLCRNEFALGRLICWTI